MIPTRAGHRLLIGFGLAMPGAFLPYLIWARYQGLLPNFEAMIVLWLPVVFGGALLLLVGFGMRRRWQRKANEATAHNRMLDEVLSDKR